MTAPTVPSVNEHLAGICKDGELNAEATIRSFRIVQREGSRNVEHYSLMLAIICCFALSLGFAKPATIEEIAKQG